MIVSAVPAMAPESVAFAQATGPIDGCKALMRLDLQALDEAPTRIISAGSVDATADLPAFCRVTGYVAPEVRFEVRLPLPAVWNGRFDLAGCGGFCGVLDGPLGVDRPGFPNCNYVLQRNYAAATTDTGHTGTAATDGLWAYNNSQAQIDFSYRSEHVTAIAAKAIITAYYGRPIAHSYFGGCSQGGRQAVMEALRFPGDFDGIISGDPALDFVGLNAVESTWAIQVNRDATGHKILDDTKVALLANAVLGGCDGLDGLVDGVIQDPSSCVFDPGSLQCSGPDRSDCLTAAQVDMVRKIYGGPRNSTVEQLYPGAPLGSELNWDVWIVGQGTDPPSKALFSDQILKYMAFEAAPGPRYDPLTFNFDVDVPKLAAQANFFNATSPDLHAFQARGGKLLMYHGWADSEISPYATLKYYDNVVKAIGGQTQTDDFFRLFMIPGMYHCSGGPGADPRDNVFAAIENWVENGVAPDELIATHVTNGTVDRTRPIYPYPKIAKYTGTGSPDEAANFIPVDHLGP
jgi:feruloyl esterase